MADGGIFLSEGGNPSGGDSAVNGLVVSATAIDFGLAECGGQPPANQKITLTNTSAGDVQYGAAVSGNAFAIVGAATGKIPAGQAVTLELAASSMSIFATPQGATEGALQIATDAPGQKLFVLPVKVTAAGAQLVLLPDVVDFGLIAATSTGNADFGFRNDGNEPLTVTFDPIESSVFGFDMPDGGGVTIPANSTATLHATYTPSAFGAFDQTPLFFHPSGVLCGGGESPNAITLQGNAGYVNGPSITPGAINFDVGGTGFVPCGQTAGTRTITLTNPVGSDYPTSVFSVSVEGPYTVSPLPDTSDGGFGIDFPAGKTLTFTVTPQPIAVPASTSPGAFDGTVSFFLGNEEGVTVSLQQTAQGAIFSLDPDTNLDFGNAALDVPAMQLLNVVNSGNAAADIGFAITGSPYFSVSPSSPFSVNTPGNAATVTYLPLTTGPQTGTLTMTTTGAVCGLPSPATLTLTGSGVTAPDSGPDGAADAGDDASDADDGALSVDTGVQ